MLLQPLLPAATRRRPVHLTRNTNDSCLQLTTTSSSSAAGRPARRSARCSPSTATACCCSSARPFPRYHIGESLIPYTWFTLNRLGVVDWLHKSASPKKYSVQFVSITGKVSQPFYFFQTIKHECAQTWQVWRGEFDAMLLDNARKKGVEVRQGWTVRDVLFEGSRVVGVRADVEGRRQGRRAPRHGRRRRQRPRFAALAQVRLEGSRRRSEQDRGLELLQGRQARRRASTKARRPSPTSRRRDGSGTSRCTRTSSASGVVGEPSYLYRDTRDADAIYHRELQACAWIRDHVSVGSNASRCA